MNMDSVLEILLILVVVAVVTMMICMPIAVGHMSIEKKHKSRSAIVKSVNR